MSARNTARVLREGRAWEREWIRRGRPRGRVQPFRESQAVRQRVPYSMSPPQRGAMAAIGAFIESYENYSLDPSRTAQSAIATFKESYRRK